MIKIFVRKNYSNSPPINQKYIEIPPIIGLRISVYQTINYWDGKSDYRILEYFNGLTERSFKNPDWVIND